MRFYWEETEWAWKRPARIIYEGGGLFRLRCGGKEIRHIPEAELLCREDRRSETGMRIGERDFHTSLMEEEAEIASAIKTRYSIGEKELAEARAEGSCLPTRNEEYARLWAEAKERDAGRTEAEKGKRRHYADPLVFEYSESGDELAFYAHCQAQGMGAKDATERWKRV